MGAASAGGQRDAQNFDQFRFSGPGGRGAGAPGGGRSDGPGGAPGTGAVLQASQGLEVGLGSHGLSASPGPWTRAGPHQGPPQLVGCRPPGPQPGLQPFSMSGRPPEKAMGTPQQWRPVPPPQQAPGARSAAGPRWPGSGLGSAGFTPVWPGSQHAPQSAWPSSVQDGPVNLFDVFSGNGGGGGRRPYAHSTQR